MLMPSNPSKQYASSSTRVVTLRAAHNRRSLLGRNSYSQDCRITSSGIPVKCSRSGAHFCFVPILFQSLSRNLTSLGARSSCNVHPNRISTSSNGLSGIWHQGPKPDLPLVQYSLVDICSIRSLRQSLKSLSLVQCACSIRLLWPEQDSTSPRYA